MWLGGTKLSAADKEAFDEIKDTPPNPEMQPNLFAWYAMVSKFSDAVRSTWKGEAANPAPVKRATAKKEEKKTDAGDDDFDPFADGGDDDEDAAAALKAKAEEAKKKKKPAPVAKSIVLWDIKGWDDTTNLDELAKKVLAEVAQEGLVWKTEYKMEPVAFGIKKLVMGAVIEDEKVSADAICERIEEYEDYVQSVDIAVFNKL